MMGIIVGTIGVIIGASGLIFGIARGALCVKKDSFTEQENNKLQELNESL